MKNSLKFYLLLISFCVINVNVFAQDCDPEDPDCIPTPTDPNTNTPGNPGTPIDGYLPVLIITAVTIAGIYSYKQRKLIQK
ncbi:hypothetical protein [Chishuiella sp.]|uniref:hypothetical protein n=1 Tax=Chishuiella sp. TaxID=1969467 RepID=UPI0028A5A7B1|nr:hypothetical protein [Chishuiella sp.]